MIENQNETPQLRENAVMQSVLISEKDFRIGNFFYGNYENEIDDKIESVICKILGYDSFNSFYWVENKEGIEDFCSFQKIPLTKKWLLRFGFTNLDQTNIYVKSMHKIGGEKLKSIAVYIDEENYTVAIVDYYTGVEKTDLLHLDYEYVHQLQNLFYALTGSDLSVS